jgi:hypothetical protein
MTGCPHSWEMRNVQSGFVVFEKCFHCNSARTYFTKEAIAIFGDEYREGDHFWHRVENAQSFRFDLRCSACGTTEQFDDLMGLLYCTGCQSDCRLEVLRKRLEAERTYLILASGFLSESSPTPKQVSMLKLAELTRYFNRRRDTSRSKIAIVPFDLEGGFAGCNGEFLHDVGMLSPEPVVSRKSPF